MVATGILDFQSMDADIDDVRDSYFFPKIFQGSPADDGHVDPREITQFSQMPFHFKRTKSLFWEGYNWSEGSVIVQKKEEILGLLNPCLDGFPLFEKMVHRILFQRQAL